MNGRQSPIGVGRDDCGGVELFAVGAGPDMTFLFGGANLSKGAGEMAPFERQ
jgi:hypothetical protein